MVALGLLERHGDRYANSPVAATFLSGATPADLRPLLRFWDRLSYPAWEDLAGALGRGRPAHEIFDIDDELVPIMSAGIEAATAGRLPRPARGGRTAGRRAGCWTSAAAPAPGRSPWRRPTRASPRPCSNSPTLLRVAGNELRTTAYSDRIDVRVGDMLADDLPRGYNAFLLANLVHYFTPETNQSILHRIRAAAEPGARLLLADFWTDPTHTQPLPAALMAGEFAIHVNDGDVYSVEEGTAWLHDTGWRYLDHRLLAGPMSVIVAETA